MIFQRKTAPFGHIWRAIREIAYRLKREIIFNKSWTETCSDNLIINPPASDKWPAVHAATKTSIKGNCTAIPISEGAKETDEEK